MAVKVEAEMLLLGSCRTKNPTEEKRAKGDVTRSSLGVWQPPECWWLLPAVPGSARQSQSRARQPGCSRLGLGQLPPWEPGKGRRRQGRVLLGSRGTPEPLRSHISNCEDLAFMQR